MIPTNAPIEQAEVLVDCQCTLGECPAWCPTTNTLHWVDIAEHRLHSLKFDNRRHVVRDFAEPVCAVMPRPDGTLILAFAKRLAQFSPVTDEVQWICPVESDLPTHRCNDGAIDPTGRVWIGTLDTKSENRKTGTLYRLDEKTLTPVLSGLGISNGIAWSVDGRTMYFIDSPTQEVRAFDFNLDDSSISNPRVVVRTPDSAGVPDGMTVGFDDTLWVAQWGGACVIQWDPRSGERLRKIHTAAPHTTSCCFGSDGELFITSARDGLDPASLADSPKSGGLFLWKTPSSS